MDQWRAIRWPRFDQADAARRIGAQAVGQYAAGRAGANDHVIEFHTRQLGACAGKCKHGGSDR